MSFFTPIKGCGGTSDSCFQDQNTGLFRLFCFQFTEVPQSSNVVKSVCEIMCVAWACSVTTWAWSCHTLFIISSWISWHSPRKPVVVSDYMALISCEWKFLPWILFRIVPRLYSQRNSTVNWLHFAILSGLLPWLLFPLFAQEVRSLWTSQLWVPIEVKWNLNSR